MILKILVNPFKAISIGILPTFQADDYLLALKLLLSPWNYFNKQAEAKLSETLRKYYHATHVFLFDSGRTSLFVLLKAMGFGRQDEILLQAFTCVVVPNAVKAVGATPIYVDIDEGLNLSASDLEKKITPRSRAVIIQHSFGLTADIEAVRHICEEHNLILIEDCAHCLGNFYQGKPLGVFGRASILSFGRDKVISGVCGGAIITSDEQLAKEIEKLISHAPHHSFFWVWQQLNYALCTFIILHTYSFFGLGKIIHKALNFLKILPRVVTRQEKQGKVDSFSNGGKVYAGLPGALSVLVSHQFDKLDVFTAHRKKIARVYASSLKTTFNDDCSYLRYNIFVDQPKKLREHAARKNIFLGDWYDKVVAPKDVELDKVDYVAGSCPQAENYCRKIVNLPTNPNLGIEVAERVAEMVKVGTGLTTCPIMNIKEINDKQLWDNFILSLPDYTFLQSWSWGEFNAQMGDEIYRLGLFDGDRLAGICLAILVQAKRGSFLFVPHGPLLKNFYEKNLTLIANKLKEIAGQEKCAFLRVSPWSLRTQENLEIFNKLGFRNAPTYMHAEETWLLNLEKSEEELLSEMRKTHRNLIRRAQKEGVEIVKSRQIRDLSFLLQLQFATAKRHGFVPFSKKYLETEFRIFNENNQCLLFLGKHDGKVLSAAIIIFYGKRAFYFQSASESSKVPVTYLLQWEVIREAKARGCTIYNFWGVAPPNKPNHPWVGLTLFKTGFGGVEKDYLHAQDLVLSPKYWLTYFIEKIPRTWREKLC